MFAAEIRRIQPGVVRTARVRWTGSNLCAVVTVLLTSRRATPAAAPYSDTLSVICLLVFINFHRRDSVARWPSG